MKTQAKEATGASIFIFALFIAIQLLNNFVFN